VDADHLHNDELVHAMREGLLASRGRLQSLGLRFDQIKGSEVLQQLQLIYGSESNHDQHNNTVLRELALTYNAIQGPVAGNHLRRLVLTVPSLKRLVLCFNGDLGLDGARALFAVDPTTTGSAASVMSRLQSLDVAYCALGNAGLAQMIASMKPESSYSAPPTLVYLNLSCNCLRGHEGGESLARLLQYCEQLETLRVANNRGLGPEGARALAPALATHCRLQNLDISVCEIKDSGASEILTSLFSTTTSRPSACCLKSLELGGNTLSATSLVCLADYLKGPGRSLAELSLGINWNFFKASNDDQRRSFFEALANHKMIYFLGLSACGHLHKDDEQSAKAAQASLSLTLLQNTSLRRVQNIIECQQQNSTTAEYMRRNNLLSKMKSTMDNKPVDDNCLPPLALWPVALDASSPRLGDNQVILVAPTVAFCLIQKMMVSNVYSHMARVYRFEKVRACIKLQRWRRGRLQIRTTLGSTFVNTVQMYHH
jgi:Leucine Rich repeat